MSINYESERKRYATFDFDRFKQQEIELNDMEEQRKKQEIWKKTQEEIQRRNNTYNLEGICSLFNILDGANDIEKLNISEIVFNDKVYSIEKENDALIIKCSDGRCLNLKICTYPYIEGDDFHTYTGERRVAECHYFLPNGNIIKFIHDPFFDYCDYKKINAFNFISNLYVNYVIPNRGTIKPSVRSRWDFNKLEIDGGGYFDFESNGIIYRGRYLLSKDAKRLLSIDGENVLPLEEVKKFNVEQEKEKLEKLLKDNDSFHPYTVEVLLDAIANLKNKESYVNEILNIYLEGIPLSQDVLDAREDITTRINNYIFSMEELSLFVNSLAQEIKKIYDERQKANDFYNSPVERAKRLIKSMSEEDLKALKKQI